jgi:hypothetical protein
MSRPMLCELMNWVLALVMGWVMLSTLTLLGVSFGNGMGAVEYPNPIGC